MKYCAVLGIVAYYKFVIECFADRGIGVVGLDWKVDWVFSC